MWFHHDKCYTEFPDKATFLYAIELPSTGGNTMFANMSQAYDHLPQTMKDKLTGWKALHVYDLATAEKVDISGDFNGIPHFSHPALITHSVTRKKALYVNRLMTARIAGLPMEESDMILEELFACAEARDIIYEHVWRLGDLLMWDNRCSAHARTDFPPTQRRLLRRWTIQGERPIP